MERSTSRNKGSTLTEAAIVLPLIMLLIFGVAQYAMIFSAYITISNAAAEGARLAITGASGGSGGVTTYSLATLSPSLDPTLANISLTTPSVGGQTVQQITITYPLNLFFPLAVPSSVSGVMQLSATSVAR